MPWETTPEGILVTQPPLLQKQIDYAYSTHRETLYAGSVRSGKSVANIVRLIYQATSVYLNGRGLFAMDVSSRIKDQFLPKLEEYLDEHFPPGFYSKSSGQVVDMHFHKSETTVLFRGIENTERIQGDEFDFIIVEEATVGIDNSGFMLLMSRLSRPESSISFTCNPGGPGHWLNQRFNKGIGVANPDDMKSISTNIYDNHFLPKNYVESLEAMPKWWKDIYLYGKWASPEGKCYKMFDPDLHVLSGIKIDRSWRFFRGYDFGLDNPFACVFCAWDEQTISFMCLRNMSWGISLKKSIVHSFAKLTGNLEHWIMKRKLQTRSHQVEGVG